MSTIIAASNDKKTVIRIGHPAYRGANAVQYCFSKSMAVRALRARGVKRNVARDAVNDVTSRIGGYKTIAGNGFDVIEVGNYAHDYNP